MDEHVSGMISIAVWYQERSFSDLLNEILQKFLTEDQSDLESFQEREGDKSVSYESFLKTLKADGKI